MMSSIVDFPRAYRGSIIKLLLALLGVGLVTLVSTNLAIGMLFAIFMALATFLAFDLLGFKSRLLFLVFTVAFMAQFFLAIFVKYMHYRPLSLLQTLAGPIFGAWIWALVVVALYVLGARVTGSRLGALLIALAILGLICIKAVLIP